MKIRPPVAPQGPSRLLCVDPGTTHSGYMYFSAKTRTWTRYGKVSNASMLGMVASANYDLLVIEKIVPQGITGKSTMDTVFFTGQMFQLARMVNRPTFLLPRRDVKKVLFNRVNGIKDKHVRAYLINFYDHGNIPIRTKGIAADAWSALALGTAYSLLYGKS